MNKTLRRITAVLAAGAMLFGTGAELVMHEMTMLTASAEDVPDGLEYEEGYNNIRITGYTGSAAVLEIPATIDGLPVVQIGYAAFEDCKTLESVTIPDGVTYINSSAFQNCTSLSSVKLSEKLTWIGANAFNGCESLAELAIPATVDQIEIKAFYNTPWLKTQLEGNLYVIINGILVAGNEELCVGDLELPDGITVITAGAFYGCTGITSVVIPEGVTMIRNDAFSGCWSMESVTFPETLWSISWKAFAGCEALEEVDIPANVFSIANDAFFECFGLKSINVDAGSADYTTVNGAVLSKDETELVICPAGLTEFTVPEGVTSIGYGAFVYDQRLESVTLPSTLKDIQSLAFNGCEKLTTVTVPEGVTDINSMAFSSCKALSELWLPVSLAAIGNDICNYCDELTDVYYAGTEEEWNAIDINPMNAVLLNATIHFNSTVGQPSGPSLPGGNALGDISGDGEINAEDAALLLEEAALIGAGQSGQFTDEQNAAADINGDGEINAADAAVILAYSAAVGAGQGKADIKEFI